MILAVVERRSRTRLVDKDVFTATVGGHRVTEPAADLAIALAVASAHDDIALPPDLVVIGELGLAGDVRRVGAVSRRLSEASRLGFVRAVVPAGCGPYPPGIQIHEAEDLRAALRALPGRV
jgi:DNA repair protein RadA/Sms